ncbi:ATP-binding protein [Streptomyces viridodiastaticus]|nr:ATP-binding protein [Streptomyces viridodiastaticus]
MTATQSPVTVHQFTMRFSSTPRGARLARRLCEHCLDAWGVPYDSDAHDVVTLVAAELCANAVQHGHVPGRDFQVHMTASPSTRTVRIEVTDTRGEGVPLLAGPSPDGEGGARPAAGRGAGRPLGMFAARRGRARQDGLGGVHRLPRMT